MSDAAVQAGTGRVRLQFRPDGGDVRVPAGHDGVRRRLVERDRDRLHLRRPRHLQEVQGAGDVRGGADR